MQNLFPEFQPASPLKAQNAVLDSVAREKFVKTHNKTANLHSSKRLDTKVISQAAYRTLKTSYSKSSNPSPLSNNVLVDKQCVQISKSCSPTQRLPHSKAELRRNRRAIRRDQHSSTNKKRMQETKTTPSSTEIVKDRNFVHNNTESKVDYNTSRDTRYESLNTDSMRNNKRDSRNNVTTTTTSSVSADSTTLLSHRGCAVPIRFANANRDSNLDVYYNASKGGKVVYQEVLPFHRIVKLTKGGSVVVSTKSASSTSTKRIQDDSKIKVFNGLDLIFTSLASNDLSSMFLNVHSTDDCLDIPMKISNLGSKSVLEVYWIDYKGNQTLRRKISPGDSYIENTYATHSWVLIDTLSRQSLLLVLGSDVATSSQKYSLSWNPIATSKTLSNKVTFTSQELAIGEKFSKICSSSNSSCITAAPILLTTKSEEKRERSLMRKRVETRSTIFDLNSSISNSNAKNVTSANSAWTSSTSSSEIRNTAVKLSITMISL